MNKKHQSTKRSAFLTAVGIVAVGICFAIAAPTSRSPEVAFDYSDEFSTVKSLYATGSDQEAAGILQTLTGRGSVEAMYELGRAYSRGKGVPKDLTKALNWQLKGVSYDTGLRGKIAYEIGKLFQKSVGEDCDRLAFEWFIKSLQWGHAKAHLMLARHYERGIGVEQDFRAALHHHRSAALAGHESAMLVYATWLATGTNDTDVDTELSRTWALRAMAMLERKAANGSSTAAKQLGRLYRDGILIDEDLAAAASWFRRGAELRDPSAMHDYALLKLNQMSPDEDGQEVIRWLRTSAELGYGGAMTALGRMHLKQQFNLPRAGAIEWLEAGVTANHPGSMAELSLLKAAGDLVQRDLTAALSLAQMGAALGHTGSRSALKSIQSLIAETTTAKAEQRKETL